jgi:hypothetical protein
MLAACHPFPSRSRRLQLRLQARRGAPERFGTRGVHRFSAAPLTIVGGLQLAMRQLLQLLQKEKMRR